MITTALWGCVTHIVGWLVSLLPGWSLPSWLTGLDGTATGIGDDIGSFAVWLPLSTVLEVLAFILAAAALALGVRITRMVISHVTGGGGSVV